MTEGGDTAPNRVCKRCLLADMEREQPAYRLLSEWLNAIAAENKAGDAMYAARLRVCVSCDQLANGACALCGCYVELRAAMKNARCPHVPPKWT